jgi:hypothetical protein
MVFCWRKVAWIMIRIRCLVCREAFRWDASQGMPEYCPIPTCGAYIGSDGKDEVAAPFISTFRGKNPDRLYRDMEAKSEFRAQQAAEMSGLSTSEVSHLRMTDMKDGMRQGDTAFTDNMTPQQRAMAAQMAPAQGSLGLQASQGTNIGPYPRAGMQQIQKLRQTHGQNYRAPVSNMTDMGIQVPIPTSK